MEKHLFVSCFIIFALYTAVLLTMFFARLKNVRAGITNPKYFRTYDISTDVPRFTRLLARNYTNLLEAPMLFFAVIALVLAMKLAHPHLVWLAYAYAASRVMHSVVHIAYNKIIHRIAIFMTSSLLLALLWTRTLLLVI